MKLGEVGDTIFLRIPAKNLIQIRCVARDMDLCLLTKSVSTCTNLPFAKYPLIGGETLLSARQLLLTWAGVVGCLAGRLWACVGVGFRMLACKTQQCGTVVGNSRPETG